MYALYNRRFVVIAPVTLLVVAYTGTTMTTTMLIHTPNALLFVVVAFIVLGLMGNLRAGADVLKVLEAWVSAYFLMTMVTNVLCSGKFTSSSNQLKIPQMLIRVQGRLP